MDNMKRIINLTQHPASPEQLAAGVENLPTEAQAELKTLLTFDSYNASDVPVRAARIGELAKAANADAALIGGAMWLMPPLIEYLCDNGIKPLYSFSRRVVQEEPQPDGSVKKVSVFRHEQFIDASLHFPR